MSRCCALEPHCVDNAVGVQARSLMTDEISAAVGDAMTDATPLGRDQGLLESTAQSMVGSSDSSSRAAVSEGAPVSRPGSMQVNATCCSRVNLIAAVICGPEHTNRACNFHGQVYLHYC